MGTDYKFALSVWGDIECLGIGMGMDCKSALSDYKFALSVWGDIECLGIGMGMDCKSALSGQNSCWWLEHYCLQKYGSISPAFGANELS